MSAVRRLNALQDKRCISLNRQEQGDLGLLTTSAVQYLQLHQVHTGRATIFYVFFLSCELEACILLKLANLKTVISYLALYTIGKTQKQPKWPSVDK